MNIIPGYTHAVAAHCEAGSVRNLLNFSGIEISEEEVFGIASGPQFYFLKSVKTPAGTPLLGIRNRPGKIFTNISRFTGITVNENRFRTPESALEFIDGNLSRGIPTAVAVDMYYMKYLPSFLHVHAPFHFVVIVGRDGDSYAISDPYSEEIGVLNPRTLKTAMNTNAKMARNNTCITVDATAGSIDKRKSYALGMARTCRDMLMPPPFIGPKGIRMYAGSIRKWTSRFRGSRLRDASMLNAVAFEEQGTGGAAFRLMYASFLAGAGDVFGNRELHDMSRDFQDHGRYWQDTSRMIIAASRKIPLDDDSFDAWYAANGAELNGSYEEIADRFMAMADFEEKFFKRLKSLVRELS